MSISKARLSFVSIGCKGYFYLQNFFLKKNFNKFCCKVLDKVVSCFFFSNHVKCHVIASWIKSTISTYILWNNVHSIGHFGIKDLSHDWYLAFLLVKNALHEASEVSKFPLLPPFCYLLKISIFKKLVKFSKEVWIWLWKKYLWNTTLLSRH